MFRASPGPMHYSKPQTWAEVGMDRLLGQRSQGSLALFGYHGCSDYRHPRHQRYGSGIWSLALVARYGMKGLTSKMLTLLLLWVSEAAWRTDRVISGSLLPSLAF